MTGDTAVGQLLALTRDDIRRAYDVIGPYLRRTPAITLDLAGPVTLKLEQLQCAGSFKARGAFTNLLLRDVPPAGVAAASGGNHGVAVAYAAHQLGIPARIFVPTVSSPAKVERIRQLADLVITAEPAAAVGVAALLTGAYKTAPGERVAVIVSGASMTPTQLDAWQLVHCVFAWPAVRCSRSP